MTEQHPMTAEQINDAWRRADDSRGAQAHLSGDVFAIIESHNSLLDEVKRWKAQSRYEYELSCKYQDQARERETELKRMLSATQADRDRVGGTLVIERDMSDRLKAEVQRQRGEIERLDARMKANHLQALHNATLLDEQRDRADRLQAENDRLRDKLQQIDGQRQDAVQESDQLRQRLEEAVEALEWYGDVTEEEDSVYYCQPRGYGVMPSKVQVDGGQRALDFLKKLKGDRTDG
jgi:chromosome segregation ATPase